MPIKTKLICVIYGTYPGSSYIHTDPRNVITKVGFLGVAGNDRSGAGWISLKQLSHRFPEPFNCMALSRPWLFDVERHKNYIISFNWLLKDHYYIMTTNSQSTVNVKWLVFSPLQCMPL